MKFTNIHLERDSKELRFLKMKWQRDEIHNTIIAFDGTVTHSYSYKTRKAMNNDWHCLNLAKQDNVEFNKP